MEKPASERVKGEKREAHRLIMNQKIAFRVDAGYAVGFGHIKRCIVLAKEIRKKTKVIFITRDQEAVSIIEKNKFKAIKLNRSIGKNKEIGAIKKIIALNSVNKILIDLKEEVSKDYIKELKKAGVTTILLDNFGEGRRNADVVIYPSVHMDKKMFQGIKGKLYHGWDYVIVDKKFFAKRKKIGLKKAKPRILVTMGGSDVHNLTPRIINPLKKIKQDFECIVVVGPGFANQKIKADDKRFVIKKNVSNMADLMLNSDIGIILFGVSVYEAAAARLPCIFLSDSDRNNKVAETFKKFGTGIYLGYYERINEKKLTSRVKSLLNNSRLRNKMELTSRKFLKEKRLIDNII